MNVRSKTFISFLILAVIYASINLVAAPPRTALQHYHVSSTQLRLLDSTVVLPIIAIWFIGLYGLQKLRRYVSYLRGNKDGQHIFQLTRGITILAYWLPISSTLSAVLNLFAAHHHQYLPAVTIIVNYLSLLFPLLAFWQISRASRRLSEVAKGRSGQDSINIMALVLIVASVLYGYLVANARDHVYTIYHMPLVMVLLTVVVPYVFCWYLGLLAAFDLHNYTKKIKGIIFRKSWNALAFGIVWIIVFSIILQYMSTVSAKLGNLSLGWILVLIYSLLPILAIGYIFVALGAKRLTKIEEV